MAALDYTAADGSRLSLRERRRSTEAGLPVGRGIIYDMYARARAMEAENRSLFADNFAASFREMVSRLDDQDAYTVIRWLETPLPELRNALQAALDGLRNKDRIHQGRRRRRHFCDGDSPEGAHRGTAGAIGVHALRIAELRQGVRGPRLCGCG